MAQVRFYAMRLDFQTLQGLMNNPEFTGLIFQPQLPDAEKLQDEFTLICYEMYANEISQPSQLSMEVIKEDAFSAKEKVMFGNLPLTRNSIQPFINEGPKSTYLYFFPKQYQNYVAYNVTLNGLDSNGKVGDSDYYLKPSPPAPPEP